MMAEFGDRVEFIRLCADGIGNVARTADPKQVQKQRISLFALVRSVCAGFGPLLHAKKIELKNAVPVPPTRDSGETDQSLVMCDSLMMRMVFMNILQNAVYWVHGIPGRPAEIHVAAQTTPTHVRITVRDNGYGIPPGVINSIWKPFYSGRRADQGMGLGLFIARRIVQELHGGKISVESEWGYSTEFTVELMRAAG